MTEPSLDAILQLVGDRRRRSLLEQLRFTDGSLTTIRKLVNDVDREAFATNADRPPDRDALAIQLHHHQLPKLDELGIIDYDRVRGKVRYLPNVPLETVLDSPPEERSQSNA